jgi:DNA-binding transcriptional LysR family regulator
MGVTPHEMLQQAVGAGAGLAVLPCHMGDADPALRRLGAPLPDVAADQWLLVHRDLIRYRLLGREERYRSVDTQKMVEMP